MWHSVAALGAWSLRLVACGFLSQSIEQIAARQFVAGPASRALKFNDLGQDMVYLPQLIQ
jgi:hypothetical protein